MEISSTFVSPRAPEPVIRLLETSTGKESETLSSDALPRAEPSKEELEKAVKNVNHFADALSKNLRFSLDDKTGSVVVKIVDSSTEQVVRQIPSEEMLRISEAVSSMIDDALRPGLIIKQKA